MLKICNKPKQCSYLLVTLATVGMSSISSVEAMEQDRDYSKTDAIYMKHLGRKPHHINHNRSVPGENSDDTEDADLVTNSKKLLRKKQAENDRITEEYQRDLNLLLNVIPQATNYILQLGSRTETTQAAEDAATEDRIDRMTREFRKKAEPSKHRHSQTSKRRHKKS